MLSLETKYAIQCLSMLAEASKKDRRLTLPEIKKSGAFNQHTLGAVLNSMKDKGIVGFDEARYYLRCDLSEVTLYELCEVVDDDFILHHDRLREGWANPTCDQHLRTMTLDTKLTVEVGDLLRRIPVAKLLPKGMRTAGVSKERKNASGKLLPHQPIQRWLEVDIMARG